MQGISVEIQPPTHQDLIGRSMTVPRSLLALSQCYLFGHLHLFVPEGKLRRAFQKLQFVYLFKNCLILQLRRNLKLNKSGGSCMSASVL